MQGDITGLHAPSGSGNNGRQRLETRARVMQAEINTAEVRNHALTASSEG